jgi:two-component system LytT family response regulator
MDALLIDDERLARRRLRSLLASHPEIRVVGEAASVPDAKDAVRKFKPDVVFLDVQMPGASGFALLEDGNAEFQTVFVTAYDEFAAAAFDASATDYLLKPVLPARLEACVGKLLRKLNHAASEMSYAESIFVWRSIGDGAFVKLADVQHISAAGPYTEIQVRTGERFVLSKSLKHWEGRLPTAHFKRIHRSRIVNVNFIDRVHLDDGRRYTLFLKEPTARFSLSRRYASRLRKSLRTFAGKNFAHAPHTPK